MKICIEPIGYVHSPYKVKGEAPKQGVMRDKTGEIEILDEYLDGIYSLKEGQLIEVFFYFDQSSREVKLKFDHHSGEVRGVFNTRSPVRPNGIGKSIVKILKIEGNFIEISNVDMLDGTPVLDIKPYSDNLVPKE